MSVAQEWVSEPLKARNPAPSLQTPRKSPHKEAPLPSPVASPAKGQGKLTGKQSPFGGRDPLALTTGSFLLKWHFFPQHIMQKQVGEDAEDCYFLIWFCHFQ